MIKLLAVKPCFMYEDNVSAITVGKFYYGKRVEDDELTYLIIDDLGNPHFLETTYLKDIGCMLFQDFYQQYAGKCKELATKLIEEFPDNLTLVRGHVYTGNGVKAQHWWTIDNNGTIHDPSKLQFIPPLTYEEFNGICECEQCGKNVKEEDAIFMGRYPTCSNECARKLVGV